MWLGAAAVTGTVLVGINPTRRGAELARDITHTDCQLIVTEGRHAHLLDGLDLGVADGRVLDVDTPEYGDALAPYAGARRSPTSTSTSPAPSTCSSSRRARAAHRRPASSRRAGSPA